MLAFSRGAQSGAYAKELKKETPSWYTPRLHERVVAAGKKGQTVLGDGILHVGHGLAIGTGGTPRAGVVTYPNFPVAGDIFGQDKNDPDAYGWNGAVTPGDSGSAARAVTGEAVGNVTHLVVGTDYLPSTFAGTTIGRMVQIAGQPLSTASLVPDPLH